MTWFSDGQPSYNTIVDIDTNMVNHVSTLFTAAGSSLNELSYFFKKTSTKNIFVNKYGARWIEYNTDNTVTFTKSSLKKALKYLLGNCFFKLGNNF